MSGLSERIKTMASLVWVCPECDHAIDLEKGDYGFAISQHQQECGE
jgi:hypothetical protein